MRRSKEPYPVRIKELDSGAKPEPPMSESKKKSILEYFKRRE
jgi:hypothetical protein